MDIGQLLNNAIDGSVDARIRYEATAQLEAAARDHYAEYLRMLAQALADESNPVQVRMLAAIEIKNQLTSKDLRARRQQSDRWLREAPVDLRAEIKSTAVASLAVAQEAVGGAAAVLVATIAGIELPLGSWPELTPLLVESTRPQQPVPVKRSSLLAIGYICEGADPQDLGLVAQMDGMLTAIVQGAAASEPSVDVRTQAINALVNSLGFIKRNFENEGERNYIMQVVCEATTTDSEELQSAAFAALSRIMSLYYQFMVPYMEQALFALTVQGMQSQYEGVASLAIEFWSTVCEEELPDLGESFNFAQRALPVILPQLLKLLMKEDEDDDDWTPAMAAGACLQLLSQVTGDAIVQPAVEFVAANIQAPEWQRREAAVMAFGSILVGPDQATLHQLIAQAFELLLGLMGDQHVAVKDTVAWCVGRIAEHLVESLQPQQLEAMLSAVLRGLRDHPKVRTHCCWTVMSMVLVDVVPEQYFGELVQTLVVTSDRPDNEFSARTSAYEALSTLVMAAPDPQIPLSVSGIAIQRLQGTLVLQQQIVSTEDRQNVEELQINLLGVLTSVIRRASSEDVSRAADELMTLLGHLLQSKLPNSLIEDDVYISIGAIAQTIGPAFAPYVRPLTSFVVPAIKESVAAVGLVADMANALGAEFAEYVPIYLAECIQIYQDVLLPLRAAVVSCIGDLAAATGAVGAFDQYLEHAERVLVDAAATPVDESGPVEAIEQVATLWEAVLDAHVGVVAGFHDAPAKLAPYILSLFQFLEQLASDNLVVIKGESFWRTAAGLVGDVVSMYPGGEFAALFSQPWLSKFVRHARDPQYGTRTQEAYRWAAAQLRPYRSM